MLLTGEVAEEVISEFSVQSGVFWFWCTFYAATAAQCLTVSLSTTDLGLR